MTIDYSVLDQLERRTKAGLGQSKSGGEPPGGSLLERRVATLETAVSSIDKTRSLAVLETGAATLSAKLDTKPSSAELATLSGKLDGKAAATDLAELKGRVARIPTVPVLTSILLFVSLLVSAILWRLRHLPPAWSAALQ